MIFKRFGKAPAGERLKRIVRQANYSMGKFHNAVPTKVSPNDVSIVKVLKAMITRPKSVTPSRELPHVKADISKLDPSKPGIIWYGHSSYLLTYKKFHILVDPVFSGNASPFKFFGKSFPGTDVYSAEDFPEIDLLILTHDHYDHLDYKFIKEIKYKVKNIVTSLGVGEHLEYWGVNGKIITELVWDETIKVNKNLKITALPSRHFSGRANKRFNTLWSSFALEWESYKIYIGGDSGFSPQFKEIGDRFGSFDVAFLECGQYSPYWPQIHMAPEETVQAAKDLNAEILFPVHWGKFVLSIHPWNEPIKRAVSAAERLGQKYVSPQIGELYTLGEHFDQSDWWNFEKKN